MSDSFHIVIAEDDKLFGELMKRFVLPIREAFPASQVTVVRTLREVLTLLERTPAPDLVLLDLTLDTPLSQTLQHLDRMEERAPVLIVTGSKIDAVREIVGAEREIHYLEKTHEFIHDSGILVRAIYAAVAAWNARKWAQQDQRIDTLRQLAADASHATS